MTGSDIFRWRTVGRKKRRCMSYFTMGGAIDISEWCLSKGNGETKQEEYIVERVMKYIGED
jgi:hypothetical protein